MIIALAPAMLCYFIAKNGENKNTVEFSKFYSMTAFIIAAMFILHDVLKYFDMEFLVFFIAPLLALTYAYFSNSQTHDVKS